MNSLSEDESGDCNSGFSLYADYFEKFCVLDEDVNVSCLKRSAKFERSVRKKMYLWKSPEANPAFFDFFSHHDVNRLGSQLSLEIIIYSADSLEAHDSTATVFHDFRCLSYRREGEGEKKQRVYLFATKKKQLYSLSSPLFLTKFFGASDDDGKKFFLSEDIQLGRGNWLCALEQAFCNLGAGRMDSALLKTAASMPTVSEISLVDEYSRLLYDRWKRTVVFVGFCRDLRSGSWKHKKSASKFYFVTLSVIADLQSSSGGQTLQEMGLFSSESGSKAPLVFCVYNNQFVTKLSKEFEEEVLSRHRDTTGRKEKISGRRVLSQPRVTETQRLEAKKLWQQQQRKRSRRAGRGSKARQNFLCKCQTCSSDDFDLNMSLSGPQQLCTAEYSVTELLKMLGCYDADSAALIDRICELSVASMDIESKTVSASVGDPLPGRNVSYREIDSAKLEGHVRKVQKPLMISHSDSLLLEKKETKIFQASDDSEEAVFKMMSEYWNFVLERQMQAQKVKLELTEPLYKIVNLYRKSFFELGQKWFQSTEQELTSKSQRLRKEAKPNEGEKKEGLEHLEFEADLADALAEKFEYSLPKLTAAWKATLPGKLEAGLDRLTEQYEIFSFYG